MNANSHPRGNTKVIIIVAVLICACFFLLAIIGLLVAIAVPGFLRARETSRANACIQNMDTLHSAVHQYMIDNDMEYWEEAIADFGGPAPADWAGTLCGPASYMTYEPSCPSGGTYFLALSEDNTMHPVACTYGAAHVYNLEDFYDMTE